MKKPKKPAGPAELVGTDLTATFTDTPPPGPGAPSEAVASLAQHLAGQSAGDQSAPAPTASAVAGGLAGQMVREEQAWTYPGFAGPSRRPLQVWRTGPDSVTAVVSDRPGDEGTSVTNAAEQVVAQLQAEYPGQQVEVIERTVQPEQFGGGVDYHRLELDSRGHATFTPVKAADLRERLPQAGQRALPVSATRKGKSSTAAAIIRPGHRPTGRRAPREPWLSEKPLLENGWGGAGSEIYFHPDGAIGRAIASMGAEGHLLVDGDAAANVLGRVATDLALGRVTAQETVEKVKRIRDQMPAGSRAHRALEWAVQDLDAPAGPLPDIPAGAPQPLVQLVRDLHAVPLARRDQDKELGPLLQLLQERAAGRIGDFRLEQQVRDLWNRRHESYEGKFEIDAAVDRAVAALKEARKRP